MDKSAAAERAMPNDDMQAPPEWVDAQASLAADSSLSLLLVNGHQPPQLAIHNNNSICYTFQTSTTHAHLCDPYCGEAFQRAQSAGETTYYRCHAGLHCFAMPLELRKGKPLAVIGGRAFLTSKDYHDLLERFRSGDLSDLLSPELLRNVVFASQNDLQALAGRLAVVAAGMSNNPPSQRSEQRAAREEAGMSDATTVESSSAHRHFPHGMPLSEACRISVESLIEEHRLVSVTLMLRTEEGFMPAFATGKFKTQLPRINYKEKRPANAGVDKANSLAISQVLGKGMERAELFQLIVGNEIKGLLVVGDTPLTADKRQAITQFCREIAMPLEVLRLREELEGRRRASHHLQTFIKGVNAVEPAEAYATILRHTTELLRSERGSLLLFDEAANELQVKAAVGLRAEVSQKIRAGLEEGVAGQVLREGRPLVVGNIQTSGRSPAPAERLYKTNSFISFPIIVGERKVGVLNMTDKAGGGAYDDLDLRMLEMIAPQMALALDRAEWHQKATQFQLLSITDPLTGLLNRRYLEERLGEELERSKRHRYPMCFLMIDIDNFKEYNDRHGHQAGDLALEMTAQCLKSALRSADIASRYGGEEFSILLPQTSISEGHVIAERIRRRVERTHYPHGEMQPHGAVTVSIGISAFGPKHDTPTSIIGAADHALYVAKSHGKNRVESYSALTSNSISLAEDDH